jgi:uncharacterized membrane protein
VIADAADLESGEADRLIFFSDAVVAIAITLLALALPAPTGRTASALWDSVRRQDQHYLAFLISFVVIAAAWSRHHHVLRYAERSDSRLRSLNMLWLLTIVLNPFATNLLTSQSHDTIGAHALRFGFYAVMQVLANAAFFATVHHLFARGLQKPGTPARIATDAYAECLRVIAVFVLSIPLFLVTRDAWLLWIAGPLVLGQIARYRRRSLTAQ